MAKKKIQEALTNPSIDNTVEVPEVPKSAVDIVNDSIYKTNRLLRPALRSLRTPEDIEERKSVAQARRIRQNEKRLLTSTKKVV